MRKALIIVLILVFIVSIIIYVFQKNLRSEKNIETNKFITEKVEEGESMKKNENLDLDIHKTKNSLPINPNENIEYNIEELNDIYLAGGCFWGLEAYMLRIYGVYDVTSGYANGKTENPKYEDLIYNNSGHVETVHVRYDPNRVSLEKLLSYYFKVIDPTSLNKQGNDIGTQYRTGIYYTDEMDKEVIEVSLKQEQEKYDKEIVVEASPLAHYYLAEEYHQDYLEKNPDGYCHIDISIVEEDLVDEKQYKKPSEEVIKESLSELQYKVTQRSGTEKPFDNEYWDNKESGIYVDIVTKEPLFSSKDKYKSGTGWPSFTRPIVEEVVTYHKDGLLASVRIEVKSRVGESHLGHVFEDGPLEEGGLRYCMNSASLEFIPYEDMESLGYGNLKHLVE